MAILKKEQGNGGQRSTEQPRAIARPAQSELVRDPFRAFQSIMRDPFQMMMRDPLQLMREMMIEPFRAFQQLAPWAEAGREGRELAWVPSFEVRETDDAFVLKGDVPGVNQDDLEVSLTGNNLRISGKREREQEAEEGTVHAWERSYGQFSRSFTLPEVADLDKVRCDLKDGVLTLVVPKKEGAATQRRKIQIGAGSAKA